MSNDPAGFDPHFGGGGDKHHRGGAGMVVADPYADGDVVLGRIVLHRDSPGQSYLEEEANRK